MYFWAHGLRTDRNADNLSAKNCIYCQLDLLSDVYLHINISCNHTHSNLILFSMTLHILDLIANFIVLIFILT
jgi:hypothetical protein